jgi:hypothetical protein
LSGASRLTAPFSVCWERIDRAETHRQAIAKIWSDFISDESVYAPLLYVNSEGTGSLWIEQLKPIPSAIALELGEFLYQLRAALDACIYEVACVIEGKRPPTDPDKFEFPICMTLKSWQGSGTQDKIKPLANEQRTIIESVQPCNIPPDLAPHVLPYSFNRALAILTDWARKDRHRKLHVVASWASNFNPMLRFPHGVSVAEFSALTDGVMIDVNRECKVASFRLKGWQDGMKLEGNPNLSLDVAIDESPTPCHDIDTLGHRVKAMKIAVDSIIAGIAKTVGVTPPK